MSGLRTYGSSTITEVSVPHPLDLRWVLDRFEIFDWTRDDCDFRLIVSGCLCLQMKELALQAS